MTQENGRYMPEGSIAATSEDVMHLIDYARINGMNDMKEDTVIIRSGMRDAMYEEKNVENCRKPLKTLDF